MLCTKRTFWTNIDGLMALYPHACSLGGVTQNPDGTWNGKAFGSLVAENTTYKAAVKAVEWEINSPQ